MSIVSLWLRFTVLLILSMTMASPGIAEPKSPSGGVIEGTVTDALTGEPLQGADIDLFRTDYTFFDSTGTDSNGDYSLPNLPAGPYIIVTEAAGYITEVYDDIPCHPLQGCDMSPEITRIVVIDGSTTSGIDIALHPGVSISGRVTAAATGAPVGVSLLIYDPVSRFLSYPFTSLTGEYTSGLMPAGTYYVLTESIVYRDELYDDVPCPWQTGCDWLDGTPIELDWGEQASGIDLALDRFGAISGTVTDSGTGLPIPSTGIRIWREGQSYPTWAWTDEAGVFLTEGLLDGTHFLATHSLEYSDELYEELPCEPDCEPSTGTPIEVSLEATTSGIDFAIDRLAEGYCTPTATSLCLTGDRFRVEATWEDFENETGPGFADVLTTDAGTFWFFNPGNIELVVKILDICDRPENRFWVFAAGLTNVGVELKVTDELTGELVSYSNSLGTPYETVLDTQAFDTCGAGSRVADAGPAVNPKALLEEAPRVLPSGDVSPSEEIPDKGTCLPSATTLCLNGGRFMAELTWLAPNGDGGPARAEPLTDETGYFWFGSVVNVEVVVKVLDACGLPSFQNYWVFGAGLTNFEVSLRITDTESGEIREYSNPQGRIFETIIDLGHFMTCP